jgi:hypothetical protein
MKNPAGQNSILRKNTPYRHYDFTKIKNLRNEEKRVTLRYFKSQVENRSIKPIHAL